MWSGGVAMAVNTETDIKASKPLIKVTEGQIKEKYRYALEIEDFDHVKSMFDRNQEINIFFPYTCYFSELICSKCRSYYLNNLSEYSNPKQCDSKHCFESKLLFACKKNELFLIKKLLKITDNNTDAYVKFKNLLFCYACKLGRDKIINFLIKIKDVDIHYYNDKPLREACLTGKLDIVKFLIQSGADVYSNNNSSLYAACLSGNFDLVKYLMMLCGTTPVFDDNLLNYACRNGNIDLINYLIKLKDISSLHNSKGLVYACWNGNLSLVKYLISLDTDISKFGGECLKAACHYWNMNLIIYLRTLGITIKDYGEMSFYDACFHGDMHKINFLLKHGFRPNKNDSEILEGSIKDCRFNIAKKLASLGIKWPCNAIFFEHIFRSTVYSGISIIEFMINNGFDIHMNEDQILTVACRKGYTDIVKYLVSKKADIIAWKGRAIHEASSNGHLEIVKYLLENSNQPIVDKEILNTSVDLAIKNHHFNVVEYLWSKGARRNSFSDIVIDDLIYQYKFDELLSFLDICSPIITEKEEIIKTISMSKNTKLIKKIIKKYTLTSSELIREGLESAIAHSNFEGVKLFLEYGVDINYNNGQPFMLACSFHNEEIVKLLLYSGVNLDINNQTFLADAAKGGSLELIRMLMAQGLNSQKDIDSAFISACEENNFLCVKYLLEYGANIHYAHDIALSAAASSGNIELVNFLLKKGISFNKNNWGYPLIRACKADKIDMIMFLLKTIPSSLFKSKSSGSRSYSHYLPEMSNFFLVNCLIDYIPSMSEVADFIIQYACKKSDLKIINVLITKKINKQAIMTLLLLHSLECMNFQMAKFAIDHGANVHYFEDNLLQWACLLGNLTIIDFLLRNGADIHANDDEALQNACRYGHYNVVNFLIKSGANVNAANGTPLKLACLTNIDKKNIFNIDLSNNEEHPSDHKLVIKFLIEHNADLHADNEAALRWACLNDKPNLDVIKYLVGKGANFAKIKHDVLPVLCQSASDVYSYVISLLKTSKFH